MWWSCSCKFFWLHNIQISRQRESLTTCVSASETQRSGWYSLHPVRGPGSWGLSGDAAHPVQHHDHRQSLVPAQSRLRKAHLPGSIHVFRLFASSYLSGCMLSGGVGQSFVPSFTITYIFPEKFHELRKLTYIHSIQCFFMPTNPSNHFTCHIHPFTRSILHWWRLPCRVPPAL